MAKKKEEVMNEVVNENISTEPLEDVMSDRYATYAKYVIQDRAIPDVRDGLKPVQRRIIFSMYKSGNTFNKPTKKCAHTVGAVMGTFHPHGDSSIYEALARMSQDWKVRYPLIDFQGNNGSIDGDSPAAYRYTESRLAELSNELIANIDKNTVPMQYNFDDTELEPVVLPARFPNLYVNGAEGIAVALATEIPPHNLREINDAIIYRIGHRNHCTIEDLLQFVKGPDFPQGGYIYNSEGLKSIYTTGKGRIEISSKAEIIEGKDINQIIISEIPYKIVKIQLVNEIDCIRYSKAIDGIIEVRDESDWQGIRIVVDIKKEARADLILQYLNEKTNLTCSYSTNIVAILDGRPKTLTLLDYVDAYIAHQVDVVTKESQFDLKKCTDRLHIVEGLILAAMNKHEVIDLIDKSKDKADAKIKLMERYQLSNEQSEAIVMMPLYKLSHADQELLSNEKADLEAQIASLKVILENPKKLDQVIIKDLKNLSDKYGDDRRTQIIEKGETKAIDKRDLIAKEDVMVAISYDGYVKRSSLKSYKASEGSLPGLKDGDMLVSQGIANTKDYLICFTNLGNYIVIPVHKLSENRWKDEGAHLNEYSTLASGEKIIKVISFEDINPNAYLALLTKGGQIKRMSMSEIELSKKSRPSRCMKLLSDDALVGVEVISGNSNLLIVANNGNASLFNENDINITGSKAGGVKAMNGLKNASVIALIALEEKEKAKLIVITDKGHKRIADTSKIVKTNRLGKLSSIMSSFKNDEHKIVVCFKANKKEEEFNVDLYLSDRSIYNLKIDDFHNTDSLYAKKNIDFSSKNRVVFAFDTALTKLDPKMVTYPVSSGKKEENSNPSNQDEVATPFDKENIPDEKQEDKEELKQLSIFDDLDI